MLVIFMVSILDCKVGVEIPAGIEISVEISALLGLCQTLLNIMTTVTIYALSVGRSGSKGEDWQGAPLGMNRKSMFYKCSGE